MTDKRIALTTCDTIEAATALARALVEERLVACVNVVPGVRSIYRWKGEIQEDGETLLVMKTDAAHLKALEQAVLRLHSYDVPEFIALSVDSGSEEYLNWVEDSLT